MFQVYHFPCVYWNNFYLIVTVYNTTDVQEKELTVFNGSLMEDYVPLVFYQSPLQSDQQVKSGNKGLWKQDIQYLISATADHLKSVHSCRYIDLP